MFVKAHNSYTAETRKSVKVNLSNAKLPAQKGYMVSKGTLLDENTKKYDRRSGASQGPAA
jgi:hypothetical protein